MIERLNEWGFALQKVLEGQLEDGALTQLHTGMARQLPPRRLQHPRVHLHALHPPDLFSKGGRIVAGPAAGIQDALLGEGPGSAGESTEDQLHPDGPPGQIVVLARACVVLVL